MNQVRSFCLAIFVVLSIAALSFGEDKLPFDLKSTTNASMEYGDIVKGHDKNVGDFENEWMEKVIIGYGVQATFTPVDTVRIAAEMKMFNEFPRLINLGATRRLYYYPYVREAQAIHSFVNNDVLNISAGAGYFPYKYNEDSRNLGEYLFRSTCYPQTLTTEFDMPYARLFGVYAKSTFFNQLNFDVVANSNQEYMAINDINLTIIGSWNFRKLFEIGGGVSFCSIISADPNSTTPTGPNATATQYVDTVNGKPDTLNYTFAGTKLMGRVAFDVKRLFTDDGFGGFFAPQDLKIYSEIALLGTKNYPRALTSPIWYMSPLERMPVTFGLNWPTNPLLEYLSAMMPAGLSYVLDPYHKVTNADDTRLFELGGAGVVLGIGNWWLEQVLGKKLRLDELSVEAEWWGNRYPNSQEGIVADGLPIPFDAGTQTIDSMEYKGDNWKWSLYGKKTFGKYYQFIFQVASDHLTTFAWDWNRQDWEESLRGPSNWYYVAKFGVLF
jgi:hypothetical protein